MHTGFPYGYICRFNQAKQKPAKKHIFVAFSYYQVGNLQYVTSMHVHTILHSTFYIPLNSSIFKS